MKQPHMASSSSPAEADVKKKGYLLKVKVKEYLFTEWLLLRRCSLSNIGGRVYVRVSVRVIFSIT